MNERQLSLEEIQNRAIERANQHADPAWKEMAFELVLQVAQQYNYFTTDDVWEAGLPETRENRALGAIMRLAAKRGFIQSTNLVEKSRRHSHNHGRKLAVWHTRAQAFGKKDWQLERSIHDYIH